MLSILPFVALLFSCEEEWSLDLSYPGGNASPSGTNPPSSFKIIDNGNAYEITGDADWLGTYDGSIIYKDIAQYGIPTDYYNFDSRKSEIAFGFHIEIKVDSLQVGEFTNQKCVFTVKNSPVYVVHTNTLNITTIVGNRVDGSFTGKYYNESNKLLTITGEFKNVYTDD